uniref:Uncharacterized protein n=1 Tax=Clytia hemisphaerica TaxID=252671 RepID=A0A7M5V2F4_9CNID
KEKRKMEKDWEKVLIQLDNGVDIQRKTIKYFQSKENLYIEKSRTFEHLLQTLKSSLAYYNTIITSIGVLEIPSDAKLKIDWLKVMRKLDKTLQFITIMVIACTQRLEENQRRNSDLREMKQTLEHCSEYYQGISNALKSTQEGAL